jgi:hypothetical protein
MTDRCRRQALLLNIQEKKTTQEFKKIIFLTTMELRFANTIEHFFWSKVWRLYCMSIHLTKILNIYPITPWAGFKLSLK